MEGFQEQISDGEEWVWRMCREHEVIKFTLNGFVIVRDTEEEAIRVLREIQGKANVETVETFREQVQAVGAPTTHQKGHLGGRARLRISCSTTTGFKTKSDWDQGVGS